MNRAWATLHSSGLVKCLVTLEVVGRRTGRVISLPLVVVDYQGERYLVAMLGQNASWVLNVRAAQGQAVLRHGRREIVRLEEVEPALRVPIVRRYLALAPGARPHIPVDRRAPLPDFERIAPHVPVFRITAPS
ncbi:nitroreductase/quinone reductase family protein [Nonomuraea sp. NPDC049480]|uniref:nitroreductase/quinone reductase family protein n=1 Tax=Nonomuraea sp. NPDC049480 TaxID=3364353 RepID=UPI003789715D